MLTLIRLDDCPGLGFRIDLLPSYSHCAAASVWHRTVNALMFRRLEVAGKGRH
jgi:hypothetical protein